MIILYVPCTNKTEAKKIALSLLKEKIIACANILPSESIYEWKGKMIEEEESILILKTVKEKIAEAEKRILELHSYDTVAIIKIKCEANKKFNDWLTNIIK